MKRIFLTTTMATVLSANAFAQSVTDSDLVFHIGGGFSYNMDRSATIDPANGMMGNFFLGVGRKISDQVSIGGEFYLGINSKTLSKTQSDQLDTYWQEIYGDYWESWMVQPDTYRTYFETKLLNIDLNPRFYAQMEIIPNLVYLKSHLGVSYNSNFLHVKTTTNNFMHAKDPLTTQLAEGWSQVNYNKLSTSDQKDWNNTSGQGQAGAVIDGTVTFGDIAGVPQYGVYQKEDSILLDADFTANVGARVNVGIFYTEINYYYNMNSKIMADVSHARLGVGIAFHAN